MRNTVIWNVKRQYHYWKHGNIFKQKLNQSYIIWISKFPCGYKIIILCNHFMRSLLNRINIQLFFFFYEIKFTEDESCINNHVEEKILCDIYRVKSEMKKNYCIRLTLDLMPPLLRLIRCIIGYGFYLQHMALNKQFSAKKKKKNQQSASQFCIAES